MARSGPIVDFASETLGDLIQTLRGVLGRIASLVAWTMLEESVGFNVAAAVSTDIAFTAESFELADAGVDQMRVQCYGKTAAGAGIAVLVYDLTNARELCRVALTAALQLNVGAWTKVPAKGSDATLIVRVLGDNVNAQTLYSVRVQARTTRAAA